MPKGSRRPLPSFAKPPVVEVVMGIQFNTLERFLIPHIGHLWNEFPDYVKCEEAPPILPVVERFEGAPQPPNQDIGLPLPRVWLRRQDETGLIQIQRDRFLHNWKKMGDAEAYPRYESVKSLFQAHLDTFETFLDERSLGSIEPTQYDITYVNQIAHGEGWERLEDLAEIFPDLAWRVNPNRFLPPPEGVNLRLSFRVPAENIRLHATIRNVRHENQDRDVILFELTARGMPEDRSREAMWEWFDSGRSWIVRGFADLTGEEIQNTIWQRNQ